MAASWPPQRSTVRKREYAHSACKNVWSPANMGNILLLAGALRGPNVIKRNR